MMSAVQTRRLILMRHASSVTPEAGTADHERALTEAGEREAHEVACAVLEGQWLPDVALVSDATRTRETWSAMCNALGSHIETHVSRSLYLGGYNEIVDALARVGSALDTVLVLGHNPGISHTASVFCDLSVSLAPACAALMHREAKDWATAAALGDAQWSFDELLTP